jgi:hypothetical protein
MVGRAVGKKYGGMNAPQKRALVAMMVKPLPNTSGPAKRFESGGGLGDAPADATSRSSLRHARPLSHKLAANTF